MHFGKLHGCLISITGLLAVLLTGCGGGGRLLPTQRAPSQEYSSLLSLYPENDQGLGMEFNSSTVTSEPETYGLVLMAEVLHFRATGADESRRRVIQATRWLMDHADADRDGKPGWGFAHAWNAFGDGSKDPENQPYTITTALVMQGMLDSAALTIWTRQERANILKLLSETAVRFCQETWSAGYGGEYFWYSTSANDSDFVVNVSAGLLGVLQRLLVTNGVPLTGEQRSLVQLRVDRAAEAVVASLRSTNGYQYWDYMPSPNRIGQDKPNDLVHHVYTIWGMELYRDYEGSVPLPWSTEDAVNSLAAFWRDGKLYEIPQNLGYDKGLKNIPARVWAVGAAIAFLSWKGSKSATAPYVTRLLQDYGTYPSVSVYPSAYSSDHSFYARFGAHVLWGLAERDFR